MQWSTHVWQKSPRLVRRAAGLGLGTTVGAINGLGTACMETTQSACQAARTIGRSMRGGRTATVVRALLMGLGEVMTAALAPLYSNIAVGMRAGVEMGRQMTDESGLGFEMVYGAGLNLQFKSRIGNEIVTGGVVKAGIHSLYPEIQCTTIHIERPKTMTTHVRYGGRV